MAAGQFTFYNNGKLSVLNGDIDLDADTFRAVLLGPGYAPDVAAHTTFGDISASEIADADYERQDVTGMAVVNNAGTIEVDCNDITFGSVVSIEAKYLVFVRAASVGLANSDLLLAYVDLNTDSGSATLVSTNAEYSVNTPSGLFSV